MLLTERRQATPAEIRARSAVPAGALARRFGVSAATIRRDMPALQLRDLPDRIYGGTIWRDGRPREAGFPARGARNTARVRTIVALVATLTGPAETAVIDVGTTALKVARSWPRVSSD